MDLGREKKLPPSEGARDPTPDTPSVADSSAGNPLTPTRKLPPGATPAFRGLKRSVSAVTEAEMDFTELVKQANKKALERKEKEEAKGANFEVYLHRRKKSVEALTPSTAYEATLNSLSKVLHNMAASVVEDPEEA